MHNFKSKCNIIPVLNYTDALGTEIILEFFDCRCDQDFMSDVDRLKNTFDKSCTDANLNIVSVHHHKFEPIGVTLVYVLSESTLQTHTYPEYQYAAINLFYCGKNVKPEECIEELSNSFKPEKINITSFPRGIF